MCRLKQFDRIPVRIFQLDLLAAWTYFHLISKDQAGLFERFDSGRQVVYVQNHSIPSARFLPLTIRQLPRA